MADAALLGGRSGDRDVGGRLYRVQRMAQSGGSQELGLFGSYAHRSSYWDWTIPFTCQDQGADITAKDNLALLNAAKHGHLDIVKHLVEEGADLVAGNYISLVQAAKYGHLEVVKYLHAEGADLTARHNQALTWAAENGHLDIVKYMDAWGINFNYPDNVPLRQAVHYKHYDVAHYMVEEGGANISALSETERYNVQAYSLLSNIGHTNPPHPEL